MEKDLFGQQKKKRKSKLEGVLQRYDTQTFTERLERLEWLQKVFPQGYEFLMSSETSFVFDEVKMAYINGEYIATILLVTAFLEHWLGNYLASKGYVKEARGGLNAILECLDKYELMHPFLTKNTDQLRRIRNPFVHLKPFEHEHRLFQRALHHSKDPVTILEEDARDAISLMYEIVTKLK